MAIIKVENVCVKEFFLDEEISILENINFEINKGEIITIKSDDENTLICLLDILCGLKKITNGKILINKQNITKQKKGIIKKIRRFDLGIFYNDLTIPNTLTINENLKLISSLSKKPKKQDDILKKLELTNVADKLVNELTKDEYVKTLIASITIKNPKILLLDDFTKYINAKTSKVILKYLVQISKKEKTTIIITTSNKNINYIANKVINLKQEKISKIITNKKTKTVGELKW